MGFTTWFFAAAVVFPVPASSMYGGLMYELEMSAAIATDSIKKSSAVIEEARTVVSFAASALLVDRSLVFGVEYHFLLKSLLFASGESSFESESDLDEPQMSLALGGNSSGNG